MSTIDYNFPRDFSSIYDMNLLTGTIEAIYYGSNKADVRIGGVLYTSINICYHCEGGNTINGDTAFRVGDVVYIMNIGGSQTPLSTSLKIIGFVDGLHFCSPVFYIKLTRDDDTLVTNTFNFNFLVYNSSRVLQATTVEYISDVTNYYYQYWKIEISGTQDVSGYYIFYDGIEHALTTQYPSKYKTGDWYKSENLIQPGVYIDTVPYFVSTYESIISGQLLYGETEYKRYIIKSSVPYKIIRTVSQACSLLSDARPLASRFDSNNACLSNPGYGYINCYTPCPDGSCDCFPFFVDYYDEGWKLPSDAISTASLHGTGVSQSITAICNSIVPDIYEEVVNSPSVAGIVHSINITNTTPNSGSVYCYGGDLAGSTIGVGPLQYTQYSTGLISINYELL